MVEISPIDYINVGKGGTFASSGTASSTDENVDELFQFLDQNDINTLLVYFHGGLVAESAGLDCTRRMKKQYHSIPDKRHVVCFVWETGPIEVIKQNLDDIADKATNKFFEQVLNLVIKMAAKRLGIDSSAKGRNPYLPDAVIDLEKKKARPFEDLDKVAGAKGAGVLQGSSDLPSITSLKAEADILIRKEARSLMDDQKGENLLMQNQFLATEPGKRGWLGVAAAVAKIAFEVLKRYMNDNHHGFYPTVMEETLRKYYAGQIGTWGWTQIKKKASEMFKPNKEQTGEGIYAGSYFLNALRNHYIKCKNSATPFNVHLIGHSAGAVVICQLLKTVMTHYNDLQFGSIFFLAPACRVDLFLKYGKSAKENGYFNKFHLYTMEEENEKNDHCIPLIYTRSLLYLISGLFEKGEEDNADIDSKIMGLHEQFKASGRYSKFQELIELRKFLDDHAQIALSVDIENVNIGLRSKSLKHGDFDNDSITLDAILHSI